MSGRIRLVLVAATVLVVVAAPSWARADEICLPLDLACVGHPLDDSPDDPVEDPADDVVDTVEETVDPVRDEVDPVVGPVVDAVDDLLGGNDIVDPPGGGGGGGVVDVPGGDDGPGDSGPGPGDGRRPGVLRDLLTFARESGAATTLEISADSGVRPVRGGHRPGFGGFVEEAITGVLLLLVLFGMTLGFVLLQDRLDRSDPKLAIAPVRTDLVRFE